MLQSKPFNLESLYHSGSEIIDSVIFTLIKHLKVTDSYENMTGNSL